MQLWLVLVYIIVLVYRLVQNPLYLYNPTRIVQMSAASLAWLG